MTPALEAALSDLEQQALRARRRDLVADIDHARFILDCVCEQLALLAKKAQNDGDGSTPTPG